MFVKFLPLRFRTWNLAKSLLDLKDALTKYFNYSRSTLIKGHKESLVASITGQHRGGIEWTYPGWSPEFTPPL